LNKQVLSYVFVCACTKYICIYEQILLNVVGLRCNRDVYIYSVIFIIVNLRYIFVDKRFATILKCCILYRLNIVVLCLSEEATSHGSDISP